MCQASILPLRHTESPLRSMLRRRINCMDIILKAGAEFIVVLTGKIMTMPGLPKEPSAEKIDLDENGNIIGIF